MIADLVLTIVIYRSGRFFLAVCPEFEVEATATSPEDAKVEVLAAVRRHLDAIAAHEKLVDFLADAGFVVDGGVLRTERRLIAVEEGRVTVPF